MKSEAPVRLQPHWPLEIGRLERDRERESLGERRIGEEGNKMRELSKGTEVGLIYREREREGSQRGLEKTEQPPTTGGQRERGWGRCAGHVARGS